MSEETLVPKEQSLTDEIKASFQKHPEYYLYSILWASVVVGLLGLIIKLWIVFDGSGKAVTDEDKTHFMIFCVMFGAPIAFSVIYWFVTKK